MEEIKDGVRHWVAAPIKQSDSLHSELCKTVHFSEPWYNRWCAAIKEVPRLHRKQWEYAYILEVLSKNGYLEKGKSGLGFAVGTEPLPAVMAAYGCNVVATDLDYEAGLSLGWDSGDQLCNGVDSLNQRGICDEKLFRQRVGYRPVNMNHIPPDLRDFDFNWSSCSFEHLGSIGLGIEFLKNQLDTLKPGGLAVHTTEYNISSEDKTVEKDPNTVIFRRKDLEEFADWVAGEGHELERLDFSLGNHPTDFHVDLPPFSSEPHIRLLLNGYVVTSVGLIIRKGGARKNKNAEGFWRRLIGS